MKKIVLLIYFAAILVHASASGPSLKWESMSANLTIEANEPSIKYDFWFINNYPEAINITKASPECEACSSVYLEKKSFKVGEKGCVEVRIDNPGILDTTDRRFSIQTNNNQSYILKVHLAVAHVISTNTGFLLWDAKETADKYIEFTIDKNYSNPMFETENHAFRIRNILKVEDGKWQVTVSPARQRTEVLLDDLIVRCNNIKRKILLCALD